MFSLTKITILLLAVIAIASIHGKMDDKSESEPLLSQESDEVTLKSEKVVEEKLQDKPCCGGDKNELEAKTLDSNADAKAIDGNLKVVEGLKASDTPVPESNDMPLPDHPDANLVDAALLDAYCKAAPTVSAPCSLRSMCQKLGDNAPSYICGTTPITALICRIDKDTTTPGSIELCLEYDTKCTSESCQAMHWPHFYPSSRYQTAVFKMCALHAARGETMRGCDTCTEPSTGILSDPDMNDWTLLNPTCPSFFTYAEICASMPLMGGCNVWRAMCSTIPNASKVFPEWCNAEAMHASKVVFDPELSHIRPLDDQSRTVDGSPSSAFTHVPSWALVAFATFIGLMMM